MEVKGKRLQGQEARVDKGVLLVGGEVRDVEEGEVAGGRRMDPLQGKSQRRMEMKTGAKNLEMRNEGVESGLESRQIERAVNEEGAELEEGTRLPLMKKSPHPLLLRR